MPMDGQVVILKFQNGSILASSPLSPRSLPRNKLRRGGDFLGMATCDHQAALPRRMNWEELREGVDCQPIVLLLTCALYML